MISNVKSENDSIIKKPNSVSSDTNEPNTVPKPKPEKKKKIRCAMCNKKLGLLGFQCKCGKMYCSAHLLAESHNCTYDFKTEQCKRLEKKLVKVVNQKVPVI